MKNLSLLMSAGSVPVLAHRIRVAAETNDRCPSARAFTSFIHKMGFYFLHLMHSRYKDKHLLNHKLYSSTNPAFHFKMAPTPQKKQPFTFVVQFHILTDLLQQSHFSTMAQAMFRIPCLTDTHFPFKQIALFFLFKTTLTGL